MISNTKLNKQLSGVAGEYYVAAELSRNGYLAAVTLRNSDQIDILASSIDAENQIAIQVKTTQGKDTWILNKKVEDENGKAENKYYAFVSLPIDVNQQPRYSIIKATDLANFIKKAHQDWLLAPGKNRKDHNARQYEEKWARAAGFRTFNNFRDFLQNIDNIDKDWTPVIDENITSPSALLPAHKETFVLREVVIPTYNITFNLWRGEPIINTFGGKPLIDVDSTPMFAELAIMHIFLKDGWEARWLESYGHGQRNIVCLAEWADLPYPQQAECPITDERIMNMLRGIATLNNGNYSGCWDVLAWKGDMVIFAESKRSKRDKIQNTQTRWLDAALRYGLKPENFLMVEWDGNSGQLA